MLWNEVLIHKYKFWKLSTWFGNVAKKRGRFWRDFNAVDESIIRQSRNNIDLAVGAATVGIMTLAMKALTRTKLRKIIVAIRET
jgi:hypothetical protein